MVTYNLEEIAYLKVSEPALQKIEKIKATLKELNCTTSILRPVIFETPDAFLAVSK